MDLSAKPWRDQKPNIAKVDAMITEFRKSTKKKTSKPTDNKASSSSSSSGKQKGRPKGSSAKKKPEKGTKAGPASSSSSKAPPKAAQKRKSNNVSSTISSKKKRPNENDNHSTITTTNEMHATTDLHAAIPSTNNIDEDTTAPTTISTMMMMLRDEDSKNQIAHKLGHSQLIPLPHEPNPMIGDGGTFMSGNGQLESLSPLGTMTTSPQQTCTIIAPSMALPSAATTMMTTLPAPTISDSDPMSSTLSSTQSERKLGEVPTTSITSSATSAVPVPPVPAPTISIGAQMNDSGDNKCQALPEAPSSNDNDLGNGQAEQKSHQQKQHSSASIAPANTVAGCGVAVSGMPTQHTFNPYYQYYQQQLPSSSSSQYGYGSYAAQYGHSHHYSAPYRSGRSNATEDGFEDFLQLHHRYEKFKLERDQLYSSYRAVAPPLYQAGMTSLLGVEASLPTQAQVTPLAIQYYPSSQQQQPPPHYQYQYRRAAPPSNDQRPSYYGSYDSDLMMTNTDAMVQARPGASMPSQPLPVSPSLSASIPSSSLSSRELQHQQVPFAAARPISSSHLPQQGSAVMHQPGAVSQYHQQQPRRWQPEDPIPSSHFPNTHNR
jgi:hypothetical protein